MERGNNQHFYRKLHSLSGIIPVGVFMTVHLFVNYTASWGVDSYNKAAGFYGEFAVQILSRTIYHFYTTIISCCVRRFYCQTS